MKLLGILIQVKSCNLQRTKEHDSLVKAAFSSSFCVCVCVCKFKKKILNPWFHWGKKTIVTLMIYIALGGRGGGGGGGEVNVHSYRNTPKKQTMMMGNTNHQNKNTKQTTKNTNHQKKQVETKEDKFPRCPFFSSKPHRRRRKKCVQRYVSLSPPSPPILAPLK